MRGCGGCGDSGSIRVEDRDCGLAGGGDGGDCRAMGGMEAVAPVGLGSGSRCGSWRECGVVSVEERLGGRAAVDMAVLGGDDCGRSRGGAWGREFRREIHGLSGGFFPGTSRRGADGVVGGQREAPVQRGVENRGGVGCCRLGGIGRIRRVALAGMAAKRQGKAATVFVGGGMRRVRTFLLSVELSGRAGVVGRHAGDAWAGETEVAVDRMGQGVRHGYRPRLDGVHRPLVAAREGVARGFANGVGGRDSEGFSGIRAAVSIYAGESTVPVQLRGGVEPRQAMGAERRGAGGVLAEIERHGRAVAFG